MFNACPTCSATPLCYIIGRKHAQWIGNNLELDCTQIENGGVYIELNVGDQKNLLYTKIIY